MQKIILASGSPRRKQLMEWAEINFEIICPETDESFPENISFEEAVVHIAKNKALAVIEESDPSFIVLAADTMVVCNDQQIGKPKDRGDAIRILNLLSGNMHKVITGVYLKSTDHVISFSDTTMVEFNEISNDQIEFYVDKYKPYDKAGAYAIQEWIGVIGIKFIQGDFYNVMGLPINRVVKALKEM
ncbi:MAG: Maf family protein [Ferruginibacter sp.]